MGLFFGRSPSKLSSTKAVNVDEATVDQLYSGLSNPSLCATWVKQIKDMRVKGVWPSDDETNLKKMLGISEKLLEVLNQKMTGTDSRLEAISPLMGAIDANLTTAASIYKDPRSYSNLIGKFKIPTSVAPHPRITDDHNASLSPREKKRNIIVVRLTEPFQSAIDNISHAKNKFEDLYTAKKKSLGLRT